MLTLNALFDLYEYTKRSENAVYFYQRDKSTMVMFKEAVKDSKLGLPKGYYVSEEELTQKLVLIGYVPFINANAVCKQLMKQYVLLYGNNNLAELISKVKYDTINEQISNAFVRLHKPFRQKSTILMVDFCHLP